MITINLSGGLGNQLFQIAATYAHAKNNKDVAVFNLNECYTPNQGNSAIIYSDSLYSNLNKTSEKVNTLNTYSEPNFYYNEIPYQTNQCLNGYFQSYKYFNNNKQEIINLFDFSSLEINMIEFFKELKSGMDINIISLHVRRGDYLNNSNIYSLLSIDYYLKCIKLIEEKINNNYKIIILSDDINWCKLNFNNENIIFYESNNTLEDLYIIKNSDYTINANSTFSWWGSYLNQNSKLNIYPSKWFNDNTIVYKIEDIINLEDKNNIIV